MYESKRFLASLLFSLLLVAMLQTPAWSQTEAERKKLEKEKKETLQKIKEAQQILSETSTRKKSSLGQLNAINRQIEARESLIQSINDELSLLNSQIREITGVIEALEEDLVRLKEEYAYMVYATSKTSNSYDRLMFIFSASTFNQMFMRIKYMQQYSEARKNQVEQIQKVKETLTNQRSTLEGKQMEQRVLLDQQVMANKDLLALKAKQRSMVRDLNEQEAELRRELAQRQKDVEELDQLIASLIRKEIERSNKNKTADRVALNSSNEAVSVSFEQSKNRLNWPVNSGFISQKFGRNPHPVMKNIMVPNDGVDIQTVKNAEVRAVFDGVVKAITPIPEPGDLKAVIMQHGEYFTVYSRLKEVNVKTGQKLKASEAVGMVYTDGNGVSMLQFQIWRNSQKLNPEAWLQNK
ncbi:peptidoglycan DD-metalloendopeptidase family protein [Porifericola rhodea]|uniref:murein hydrolase activator EnvC family protein n=1 Tax=Porifericola rhodea TaxID=930972 RepID=UPI0026668561|nr:peptidoglycan DD-metalloendopeptidase family protein [Porifericola rhodea]WKN32283.1 peptidoglycan DD-metalloendopeptidase family protein [Porifericola rhodea]